MGCFVFIREMYISDKELYIFPTRGRIYKIQSMFFLGSWTSEKDGVVDKKKKKKRIAQTIPNI